MASPEASALLERWREEKDFAKRDILLQQLQEADIFPKDDEAEWEKGLYPDLKDPGFLPKLIKKREFLESKQKSVKDSLSEGDKCRSSEDFEINPVQRFVSRVLSPRTPYNSFLLYHGVGVGKTCAAITVCESYLEAYPSRKIYIVAPPNIQEGFRRTIFDMEGLKIPKNGRNSHRGCTADIYLGLTNTFDEKDPKIIQSKVEKAVKGRYKFFGYTSFYNHIRNKLTQIPAGMGGEQAEIMKRDNLRKEFSNRVIIVDEAHNLRDILTSGRKEAATAAAEAADDTIQQDADSKGGKLLTPYLKQVLEASEGLTLLLMTATPMYNSYTEIVFLLNLLLMNDKFRTIKVEDIFDLKTQNFTQDGRKILGKLASQYISFMRGENPLTFPLRLDPQEKLSKWANKAPNGTPISDEERNRVVRLPCIGATFAPDTDTLYKAKVNEIISSSDGLGITNMDLLIQAGNWIFPPIDDDESNILDRIRQGGFDNTFEKEKRGSTVQYRAKDPSWLLEEALPSASAKASVLLRRLRSCKGVAFVYSRFVASGALTIALALEANGYTNASGNLLANGSQKGRQCALCNRFEKGHGTVPAVPESDVAAHTFKPAKYVLLTGSEDISPDNAKAINMARSSKNTNGEEVKVIIGSQIAGEGLDLRYVREVFVFDSWYHLNKLEQIIGRGIRNCSHAALPDEKKNCTVSLLVNSYSTPEGQATTESIDMYSYRTALRKAMTVGNVTRTLKENAMDCSLNHDAILVEGLDPIDLIDSQGVRRNGVNRNDVPLTPMCDWLEDCDYSCYFDSEGISANIPLDKQDTTTYDEYTARIQVHTLRKYIEDLFGVKKQSFITFDSVALHFNTIPRPLLASVLADMVQKKEFRLSIGDRTGRLLHKNGYYVFQPDAIKDTSIPIAIRVAQIPLLRDEYTPKLIEKEKADVPDKSALIGDIQSKKVSVGDEDTEELWDQVLEWSQDIHDGKSEGIPDRLLDLVSELRDSKGIYKAQEERISMIEWIYKNIKDSPDVRARFADCVRDYFWDEFITYGTRRELLTIKAGDPIIRSVAKDMFWTLEGKTYIRIINYNNVIEYLCVGPRVEECSKAVSEVLSRETGQDPILRSKIDVRFTGYEYGFILYNPKKQKFVFKNGKPPVPGGKIGRGSECAINSKIEYPLRLLEKFGTTLRAAGMNDLGLNEDVLSRRRIQNSIRICTACDLVLRYMDKAGVQKKRWFYRPLEAKLHGHPLR